uniref:Putative late blight resistance protein homolog R1B-12 n=1 Tax=Solanum demissum TaxID=50514 RepID=R1B12_SOLDE|nr:RecName: Full=Putative late blight resistance protein homolog R1B-12 [Solanum demissum]AAT38782.2 Late blight resistance protein, putative [Solanum demissum]
MAQHGDGKQYMELDQSKGTEMRNKALMDNNMLLETFIQMSEKGRLSSNYMTVTAIVRDVEQESFAFASECGILDVSQKMLKNFKSLCAILRSIRPDASSNNAFAYWKEVICKWLCATLLSTRPDAGSDDGFAYWKEVIWKTKQEFRAKYPFPETPFAANKVDDVNTHSPKFVMEFIDAVVGNLNVLVKINDPSSLLFVPGPNEQTEQVLKELKLLRFFVCFVSNKCIEPQYRRTTFYTHALIEASHITMVVWLHFPIYGNGNQDLNPGDVSRLLSDFMEMKIKSIQLGISRNNIYIDVLKALKSTIPQAQNKHAAESGIEETPTHNLMVGLSDQMANLREMICLLRDNLIHLPILDLEFHVQDMDSVIVDAGLLFYSLYDIKGEKEDKTLEDINQALGFDIPRNIEPIKAMVYLVMQKAFQSNLPRIHGLGYVDFLLKNLKDFQGRYSDSLAFLKNQLQVIQTEFESLQPFLKVVVEEPHNRLKTLNEDCATQIIRKAYEVEYVVDACINKEVPQWCIERWLLDIIEEITCIKANIQEKNTVEDTMKTVIGRTSSQLTRTPRMNEEIVGFEDVIENLRKKLLNGTKGQDVISIHGMPGLGKTTLANRLYSDRSVVSQFDICAQCCVSQVYSYKELLLALLCDAVGEDSARRELPDNELADMFRKTLLPRRYLILVDDVWENSAWDDLRGCFPDVNNRSRIILTTRHHEVAKYASVHSDPLHLRMFGEDESWKLLEKKVFGEERCSPLLKNVGLRIAKMCGRLPLSIVLVAGILSEMEKEVECWEQVANNLGSHIHNDSRAIVDQSYHVLPFHLKSCFLYFGAFLEDRVINVSRLIRLWISESFIKSCEGRRLEDIAEGYLENLIGRNLVMVTQRANSDGKVKACRLHDVLLDFCKERAAEENFLLRIKWDQSTKPSSCVYSHKQHAHLAFTGMDNLLEWSTSGSLVGSVLFKNYDPNFAYNSCSSHAFAISRILPNFKFLKVLDLEHQFFIDFIPTELLYLRYLSARIGQNSIPSSISNLWNLETLILKDVRYMRRCRLLQPNTVWDMVKLRHLHIPYFSTEKEEALLENSAKLYDLETLSTPYFFRVENAELMLRKTPNLRKLICAIECLEYPPQYHVLNFPITLEILKLYRSSDFKVIPFCISAQNLKYLKLSGFYLNSQYLSETADHLKHLEVLKLHNIEFGGHSEWEVSNAKFPQLKILKLEYVSLMKLIVADDAFPNLEQLVLHDCEDLMEIPSCFMDILSLKYIEVDNCSESVVKSARNIQETQVEDSQNNNFKLVIVKKMVLKFDTSNEKEISKAFDRLLSLPGIQSIAVDSNEKKFIVIGDMDADEVRLVVGKLINRGML